MELNEIKDLMESFDKSELSVLEIEQGEFKIRVEKEKSQAMNQVTASNMVAVPQVQSLEQSHVTNQGQQTMQGVQANLKEQGELVKAPLVGIFYAAASPEAMPYVQVGSQVKEGDTLCLIEAMKMMSEINAPKSGTIKKIFVKNQDVVGFEDPLFLIGD